MRRRRARAAAGVATIALGAAAALAPSAQAGSFTVTSLADAPANACDASCTLRDALDAGTADPTPDTITFATGLSGTIELTQGQLEVYDQTNLQGPGAGAVTVDGNGLDNVFYVRTEPQSARIAGLTVTGGNATNGGGIFFEDVSPQNSTLTIDDVTFSANSATYGGAINASIGILTVSNSRFVNNFASDSGGAIAGSPESLTASDSTFANNTCADDGGAIRVAGSVKNLLIEGSTFSGNKAKDGGALLLFGPSASGTIRNSTLTGNTATVTGGAITDTNARDITTQLQNSTVTGNTAATGGGVYRRAYDDPASPGDDNLLVSSTIIAANTATTGPDIAQRATSPPAINGSFIVGNSLIGNPNGGPITTSAPNLTGVDPQLGPLADNGGPTQTMLPATGSPVINAGTGNALATDQRGAPRTSGGGTDIGAVELGVVEGAKVSAKKKQKQKGKKIQIKVKAGAAEAVSVTAGGTVSIKGKGKKLMLKAASGNAGAGGTVTLKLKPASKGSAKKIAKALGTGKKVQANLDVTMTGSFGAAFETQAKVKLK
ncbi:MAG: choice-of-anchor Q domain-containing protein [Solirubrobacterales bacterium]